MILPEQITIVTPTYRRKSQLRRMLGALTTQTSKVGQILIADGGRDAGPVVEEFYDVLPVKWLDCTVRGQIAQRNFALGQLRMECRVVLYMDDDIVMATDCIKQLVAFWNRQKVEPAGVGLNITNMPNQPDNPMRHFFLMGSRPMGRVLKSGYNSPVTGVSQDLETQWLNGGATAWSRDILQIHSNTAVETSWAVGEDLMFSYPISKHAALYVCAAALCTHEDEVPPVNFAGGRFRAYRGVVSRFVFVTLNPELSRGAFLWMIVGQILGRSARCLKGQQAEWGYLVGTLEAARDCLYKIGTRDATRMLTERNEP